MSRKQKKTFNLANTTEIRELMKQLYGDVTDDTLNSTAGETRATVASGLAEFPSNPKGILLQDK